MTTARDPLRATAQRILPNGRARVEASQVSLGAEAAKKAEAWQISMSTLTLTGTGESGMIYIKNLSDTRTLAIDFAFINQGVSTGGVGHSTIRIYRDVTGGDLVSDANPATVLNRNLDANKPAPVDAFAASAQSKTIVGDEFFDVFNTLTRLALPLDTIQIPKGGTIALSFQPPAGNTNMVAKINLVARLEAEEV